MEYLSAFEGSGDGALSFERWRRALGAVDGARVALGRAGTNGDCVCAKQSGADLFDCGCEGRRDVPLGRWWRELDARIERCANLGTRVVFLRSERRYQGSGHGLRAEY